ncbi:MAG: S-layer homology domain-containing protein [Lysinibacillus sp.]
MRRLLYVMIVLLFTAIIGGEAEAQYFSDVKEKDYYYDAVNSLYERGIISGKGDGKFVPADFVTRGQAAKMLALALQLEPSSSKQKFRDVSQNNGNYDYIQALAERGIINGFSDGTFKPNVIITRNQMAKILANAYKLKTEYALDYNELPYVDVRKTSSYYSEIQALSYYKIASHQEKFNGSKQVTRGQMAAFLERAEHTDIEEVVHFEGADESYIYTSKGQFLRASDLTDAMLRQLKQDQYITIYYNRAKVYSFLTEQDSESDEDLHKPDLETEKPNDPPVITPEESEEDAGNSSIPQEHSNAVTIHTSNIGLFNIISVKEKSGDSAIKLDDESRNNVYFTVDEEVAEEGMSKWFTIKGESYVYDYIIEIDVEVYYENNRLTYDFHFEPTTYTLTAKDFISEKIVSVNVLNKAPIEVEFDGQKIKFNAKEVSAIPVQVEVITIQQGKEVTFYRNIFVSADGKVHEDIYHPFKVEFIRLFGTQHLLDPEGVEVTGDANFLYVHGDFKGAKIPVLQDAEEIAKYGVYSNVGLPSEVGQHVMILLPEWKNVIWDEVTDDSYHVDEFPIPEQFSKVFSVNKDTALGKHQDSIYNGLVDNKLQFSRAFFGGFGYSNFVISGLDHSGNWLSKRYVLSYNNQGASLTVSYQEPQYPIEDFERWIYEGNRQQLAYWLGDNEMFNVENVYAWNDSTEENCLAFADYLISKYQQGSNVNDLYNLLDIESNNAHANIYLNQLLDNPYSIYGNYVLSQLIARSTPSEDQKKLVQKYERLIQKVQQGKPFEIYEASANVITIEPALNNWYENQTIQIEQNGQTYTAKATVDYPYGVYFNITNGDLLSGPLKITVTDQWGKKQVYNEDTIVMPYRTEMKDLGNNEFMFKYNHQIEVGEDFLMYVKNVSSEDVDFIETAPIAVRVENGTDLIVKLSNEDYAQMRDNMSSSISGLIHRYNGQEMGVSD